MPTFSYRIDQKLTCSYLTADSTAYLTADITAYIITDITAFPPGAIRVVDREQKITIRLGAKNRKSKKSQQEPILHPSLQARFVWVDREQKIAIRLGAKNRKSKKSQQDKE